MSDSLKGTAVLVVEDEPLIQMMLEDMLEDMGASVAAAATTLNDGLEKAAAGGFQIAILDVNLGRGQVYPVAELLAKRGIPFIFASGYGAADIPEAFAGSTVVAKPYRMSDLEEALTSVLAKA